MPNQLSDPCIGIAGADEEQIEQYRHWFDGLFHIIPVTQLNQTAFERLDITAVVIIIDCQSVDGNWSEALNEIDTYSIESPLILVTSEQPTPTVDLNIDAWLHTPIDPCTLIETVERLYINELYSNVLDTYVTLAKRRAEIDTDQSPEAVRATPEYQILMTKLEQARAIAEKHREQVTNQLDDRVFKYIPD